MDTATTCLTYDNTLTSSTLSATTEIFATFWHFIPSYVPDNQDPGLVISDLTTANLAVGSWCSSSSFTVTPSSLVDQTYYLSDPSLTPTFIEFTTDSPGTCDDLVFDYTLILPASITDISAVTITSATRTISISSSDPSLAGVHTIEVRGTDPALTYASFTF